MPFRGGVRDAAHALCTRTLALPLACLPPALTHASYPLGMECTQDVGRARVSGPRLRVCFLALERKPPSVPAWVGDVGRCSPPLPHTLTTSPSPALLHVGPSNQRVLCLRQCGRQGCRCWAGRGKDTCCRVPLSLPMPLFCFWAAPVCDVALCPLPTAQRPSHPVPRPLSLSLPPSISPISSSTYSLSPAPPRRRTVQ